MGTPDDLVTTLTVVLGLIGFCAAGYIMALMDFRPKEATGEEEPREEMVAVEPGTTTRQLTLSELGLSEFGDLSVLSPEEQRRLKMEEHVRNFGQTKPEDMAEVIRSWLRG